MPGVYVHIPFCRRKCYYCDFYSLGARNAPMQQLCEAILAEADSRRREWTETIDAHPSPVTMYIGGGTPSLLPSHLLASLIVRLKQILGISSPAELTVEVNPEDVTPQLISDLTQAGVNRVSMGIQSLCDAELHAIGRTHTARCAQQAASLLAANFDNVSLDLMFGLPGQDLRSWERTVAATIDMRPAHISAYSLMWEERTALYKMQSMGKVYECDPELSVRMFGLLGNLLTEAGYERYEISNYALPGYQSVHNSSYWTGVPYLGLGPAAHSYDGATTRRANPADVKAYINHFQTPRSTPFYTEETLNDVELREEYIMTRLRRSCGIDVKDYTLHFGLSAARALRRKAMRLPHLLYSDEQRIALLPEWVMCSDTAILALI